MKRAPLSIEQLFRISWWLLVTTFVVSIIDWYFLESEYRDYLRILGIFSFAGYLIGLVAIMQSRMKKNEPTANNPDSEKPDNSPKN